MSSKQMFSRILSMTLVGSLLGSAACSNFLDEKRQEPQTLEMSNAKFKCLQSLPVEINKFIQGKVNESDIRSGFQCATDALLYFKTKTKGTFEDAYAMEDLRNFFGKYFLKKNNVSAAFGSELFKLKKVLVGGSEKTITKAEIQRLIDILNILKEQAVTMAPHVPTLLGQNATATWQDVDNSTDLLSLQLSELLKQVDVVKANYSFEDLKKFMDGLDDFINATETFYLTEQLGSNIPLIEAAKNILVGENAKLDNLREWEAALKTGMGLFKEALRYHYFLSGKEIAGPEQMRSLMVIANDGFQLLEESPPMQARGAISFAYIDALLDQLELKKLLPMNLSSQALKETYKKVILRILAPERRGDARGLYSLERSHVAALKHELKVFQAHQNFIDQLAFDANTSVSIEDLKKAVYSYDVKQYATQTLKSEILEQEALVAAWQEGAALMLKIPPVYFNQAGRLMIVTNPLSQRQSWSSLTKWNLMRALTRFLLLGYGSSHDPLMYKEEMRVDGLEQWYADFNLIGTEMKAFDKRSKNAGTRSFMEANFFTFNGNGDTIMNFQETFDFVSFLLAGGMTSSESIRRHVLKPINGCALPQLDAFDYPLMKEECFKNNLRQNFASYFDNLPGMVREVSAMNDTEWNEFYGNLMSASRVSDANGGIVETADLRTAVMILHYTESLMTVFDRDGSGKLNSEEIGIAAPRFYEFMKKESPSDSRWLVKEFFKYLVYKGEKPGAGILLFPFQDTFGSLEDVGRAKILRVFKVLKDGAAKK
jgi:hypothetical protein